MLKMKRIDKNNWEWESDECKGTLFCKITKKEIVFNPELIDGPSGIMSWESTVVFMNGIYAVMAPLVVGQYHLKVKAEERAG